MLEYLVTPIEWKADESDGNVLIGYASTFGNVDLGGDVVVKGAFVKTIQNIKANGIPLLADHMPTTASVLGTIFDAAEDARGLKIWARVSKAPSAQDTAIKLREGHLSKLSIGYETMEDAYEDRDGFKVRLLKELRLWETSVVVFPMNPKADVTGMKSMIEAVDHMPDGPKRKGLSLMLLEAYADDDRLRDQPYLPKWWTTGPTLSGGTITDNPASGSGESHGETKDEGSAKPEAAPEGAAGEAASTPDEGAAHWDKYRSEALLAGRDDGDIDPGKRANLQERLRIQLAELSE